MSSSMSSPVSFERAATSFGSSISATGDMTDGLSVLSLNHSAENEYDGVNEYAAFAPAVRICATPLSYTSFSA